MSSSSTDVASVQNTDARQLDKISVVKKRPSKPLPKVPIKQSKLTAEDDGTTLPRMGVTGNRSQSTTENKTTCR